MAGRILKAAELCRKHELPEDAVPAVGDGSSSQLGSALEAGAKVEGHHGDMGSSASVEVAAGRAAAAGNPRPPGVPTQGAAAEAGESQGCDSCSPSAATPQLRQGAAAGSSRAGSSMGGTDSGEGAGPFEGSSSSSSELEGHLAARPELAAFFQRLNKVRGCGASGM